MQATCQQRRNHGLPTLEPDTLTSLARKSVELQAPMIVSVLRRNAFLHGVRLVAEVHEELRSEETSKPNASTIRQLEKCAQDVHRGLGLELSC